MMSVAVVDIKNLKASYADKEVLHGVDVTVREGETFGVIGLNGAGKTTMIKILLGLKDPLGGEIALFGKDRAASDVKAQISYLPERFDPPWFLKGAEFIRFSAALYGRKVTDAEMEDFAVSLALDPAALKRKVQTYSKGMRQKLGLIATILTGCSILILDEPMSGLDPLARALVKDVLLKVKKQGRTVILSSHILADMDEICDRITVIHDGLVHFEGVPAALREKTGEPSLEKAFLRIVRAGTGEGAPSRAA